MDPVNAHSAPLASYAGPSSPWRAMMPRAHDGSTLAPAETFTPSEPEPTAAPSPGTARRVAGAAAAGALHGPLAVPLRLILIGPPGSGKSTQGRLLAERFGIPHVSVGDLVRAEIASGSEVGRRIEDQVSRGGLAPSGIVAGLVENRLKQADAAGGFILDGYPRELDQVPTLEKMRERLGWGPLTIAGLEVPRDEVIRRLSQRGRADDTPETIAHRMDVYENETQPVLTYFKARGEYLGVDGTGTVEEVAARLAATLNAPALARPQAS